VNEQIEDQQARRHFRFVVTKNISASQITSRTVYCV
jgi:hypothetical protein